MSDSGGCSADEDDALDMSARVAEMLRPVNKKQKKTQKRVEELEASLKKMSATTNEQLAAMRKAFEESAGASTAMSAQFRGELAGMTNKSALEMLRQEQQQASRSLQTALEEVRTRSAAQEMLLQALEGRIEAAERAQHVSELKISSEIGALGAKIQQLCSNAESFRADVETRLSEAQSRQHVQHESLSSRLAVESERREQWVSSSASKADLTECERSLTTRASELAAQLATTTEQLRMAQAAVQTLQATHPTLARTEAIEHLQLRVEAVAQGLRDELKRQEGVRDSSRTAWEDRVEQRYQSFERAAMGAKRDWHEVAAKVEDLQRQLAERGLSAELADLKAAVQTLAASSADKADLAKVRNELSSVAKAGALEDLAAEVKVLQITTRATDSKVAETAAQSAGSSEVQLIQERIARACADIEGKLDAAEAKHLLAQKMDSVLGEEMQAQLQAAQERLQALHERANAIEARVTQTRTELSITGSEVGESRAAICSLKETTETQIEKERERTTEQLEIVRAVRALVQDAEMRAALDERELEFLWAAPTQIYGANGWRPNNGSLSERTPYPAGNFQVAVRHGSEGHAKDLMHRRKQLLNSITLGHKQANTVEAEAACISGNDGTPIRLPSLDELPRQSCGQYATYGNSVLEPARAIISSTGELREFGKGAAAYMSMEPPLSTGAVSSQGRPLPSEGSPVRMLPRKTPRSAASHEQGIRDRVHGY